jgi:FtsP/CotA-like multicopper oxidase with cupredoxin domain
VGSRYPDRPASVKRAMKRILVTLGVVAVTLATACGAAPVPASGITIVLHQTDAGKTFNVHGGDTVRIILVDTYPVPGSSLVWSVAGAPATILQPGAVSRSPQVRASGPGRTDTYTAEFRAISAGQALLDAKGATTCEAMAKSSCPDQHFTITVIVGR